MEHLCLGSYVRILASCAVSTERKYNSFCEKIMLSICPAGATSFSYVDDSGSTVDYDYTNFGKIHTGSQNLPTEVINMAKNKNPEEIHRYFIQKVIPCLEEKRKPAAVLGLQNVILKDSIPDTTDIGTLTNWSKKDLYGKTQFVLSEFLTDVFIYAVTKTDNTKEKSFTKGIKKDFYTVYEGMEDKISFYTPTRSAVTGNLGITSKGHLGQVIVPVSSERLAVTANHDCQIFCLKFDDTDFDYNSLWKYLRTNIGYYVFSRLKIDDYMNDPVKMANLTYDAIYELGEAIKAGKVTSGNELGELLLYIFLEQVLNAPKLMSRVELSAHSGYVSSESSGIHLFSSSSPIPFSQIVLGTAVIEGDVAQAIDDAFRNVKALNGRKKAERRFVEAGIFKQVFDEETYDELEEIILPSDSQKKKPNTAFGIFLGYSIQGVSSARKSVDDYQNDVMAKVKNDLKNCVPLIEDKLVQHGLTGQSVYIYLLPFSDADADKKSIMDNLLLKGGTI